MELHKKAVRTVTDMETRTRRQKVFAYFKDKREWAKLNGAYIVGATTGAGCAYASSYIAEAAGLDKASATTWVAGISAYISGITGICIAWWLMHKKQYADRPEKILRDAAKLVGTSFVAQACTWAVSWTGTALAVHLGASTAVAVTIQQIIDRAVFIPLFNLFNRKRVHEMETKNKSEAVA